MKKLYAKTSFARKNSNKNAKQLVDSANVGGPHTRHTLHTDQMQPILAFQSEPSSGQIHNYRPYVVNTMKKYNSDNDVDFDDNINDFVDADDDDGFLSSKFQTAPTRYKANRHHETSPGTQNPRLYYSISELSKLNMIDHRHPQYEYQRSGQQHTTLRRLASLQQHKQQISQQQQQQPQHKLVLKIPMVSDNIINNDGDNEMYAKAEIKIKTKEILTSNASKIQTSYNERKNESSKANVADHTSHKIAVDVADNDAGHSLSGGIGDLVAAPQIVSSNGSNVIKLPVNYISSGNNNNKSNNKETEKSELFCHNTASIADKMMTLNLRRPASMSITHCTRDAAVSRVVDVSDDVADAAYLHGNSAAPCSVCTSVLTAVQPMKPHQYQLLLPMKTPQSYNSPQEQHKQQQQKSVKLRRHLSIATINFSSIEQSIIGARASVMVYDDNQKKWVPSGTSSGLSKVQIYHHQQHNTFRVVGRKLQDHEVVINCSIMKGLKYNQATATFHQWRDSKYVYGLNFSSQHDAEAFARAMMHALEVLSGRVPSNPGLPTNGNGYEEDMGYRTMTSEDAAILRQQQSITGQVTPNAQTPTSQTNQNNIPQSPPTPQGHHRTSRNSLSAPPAPQPPQMSMPQQQQQQQQQAPQQHYGQPGSGPTQNGIHQTQSHPQIPPAPAQTAAQYQQQQAQAQQHAVYAAQGYATNQYQPTQQQQLPHYMLTNSNSNINLQQYSQQQQQQQQPGGGPPQPPVPPHQTQNGMLPGGSGAPIYVSSQAQLAQGIPTSASANSVVYASQPQMGGGAVPQPPQPPQPPMMQQQQQQQQNGTHGVAAGQHYGQQNGGHLIAGLQQQESPYGGHGPSTTAIGGGVPMPPPLNRMSSTVQQQAAPVAPPPPPSFGGAPMYNGAGSANVPQPPQPPAPPAPPMAGAGAAPPPPPPPPMGGAPGKVDNPQADLMDSLASQLQQVKLKKKASSTTLENSGGSTNSGGSAASGAGNYGTIGRGGGGGGMASMMDEMAKTLARRRAQAEKKEPDGDGDVKQRPWEKSNTLPHKLNSSSGNSNSNPNANATSNSGNESPRPLRKRFGSASEETILQQVNGDSLSLALSGSDLETLKADILREMRQEMQKIKQDIIEVIKSEFNRR